MSVRQWSFEDSTPSRFPVTIAGSAPPYGAAACAIDRVRKELLSDLSVPLSLGEVAERVSMSREQCVRAFSKRFGLPPCRFRMYARVQLACSLLLSGNRATSVAFECGFADQSHMNRWFKKLVGVTPGQYAAAVGEEGHREVGMRMRILFRGESTPFEIASAVTAVQVAVNCRT